MRFAKPKGTTFFRSKTWTPCSQHRHHGNTPYTQYQRRSARTASSKKLSLSGISTATRGTSVPESVALSHKTATSQNDTSARKTSTSQSGISSRNISTSQSSDRTSASQRARFQMYTFTHNHSRSGRHGESSNVANKTDQYTNRIIKLGNLKTNKSLPAQLKVKDKVSKTSDFACDMIDPSGNAAYFNKGPSPSMRHVSVGPVVTRPNCARTYHSAPCQHGDVSRKKTAITEKDNGRATSSHGYISVKTRLQRSGRKSDRMSNHFMLQAWTWKPVSQPEWVDGDMIRRQPVLYQSRTFTRASSRFCDSFENKSFSRNSSMVASVGDNTKSYTAYFPLRQSIHNDAAVIKGRHVNQPKTRLTNDVARQRPADFINKPKSESRPKAAEKGARLQSLPSRKEPHANDVKERSVSSAPSKDQKPPTGPMPKINSFMGKDQPQPEPQMGRARTEKQKSDAAGTSTQNEDKKRTSKFSSSYAQAKAEHVKSKQNKVPDLPPDDNGPVFTPIPVKSTTVKEEQTPSPVKDDFKYYASERQKTQKELGKSVSKGKPEVPPLRLHSEKSYKTDKTDKTSSTGKSKAPVPQRNTPSISPTKSEKSKGVSIDAPVSPFTEQSDNSKRKREVTIIDPKELRRDTNEGQEPFPEEYEFKYQSSHNKKFEDMDEEEKVEYFKTELHMKPEQIRELTFHPKVNEPKVIHHTYTGLDLLNWSAPNSARGRSGRRSKAAKPNVYKKVHTVIPYQRKSYMLNKLQGVVYRHINKVYGSSPRNHREKQFLQKVSQIQIDDYQRRYANLAERERKRLESMFRQREQLKTLRKKFEDDAWRRFMTQYVTSKVVEAEYRDRQEYGLPNELIRPKSKTFHSQMKRTLTPKSRLQANKKKYGHLFKIYTGPEHKTGGRPLKFEGIDSVDLETEDETGQSSMKRQNVNDLIREANKILQQQDYEENDDEPKKENVKRPPLRQEHLERPKRHRSRHSEYSDHKSTKSSEKSTKPAPKTMRELIDRRRDYVPSNRYKASEFSSMKSNLLKDSAELNAAIPAKKERIPESKQKYDTPSKSPKLDKPAAVNRISMKTPPPDSPQRTPTPKPSVVVTTSTKTETTVHETVQGQPQENNKTKRSADFLEHTETQMALDLAKDQQVETTKEGSAQSPEETKSKATKTVTVTTTTTVVKDENGDKTIVNGRQQQQSPERGVSRLSVNNKKPGPPVMASRNPSRASMQQIYGHKAPPDSKHVSPQRRPSIDQTTGNRRASITSNRPVNGHISRLEQNNGTRKASLVTSTNTPQGTEDTTVETEQKQPSNGFFLTDNAQENLSTPVPSRMSESVKQDVKPTSPVRKGSKTSVLMKDDINGTSPTRKPPVYVAHVVQQTMTNKSKETMPDKKINTKSDAQPSKSMHVDRKVSEQVHETVNTKSLGVGRPTKKETKSPQNQYRSRTPPRKKSVVNGYDSRVSRDDYERTGHDGKRQSRRSDSVDRRPKKGRQSPRSKTRKRSTSSERRHGSDRKGSIERKKKKVPKSESSRFPAIEGRSSRHTTSPKTRTEYSERVEDNEYERILTPKATEGGGKQWKDLVQKYIRQPSPKVGKTENRVIIDTIETDDDDDEIDIFERAKRRYALDSDDDDE